MLKRSGAATLSVARTIKPQNTITTMVSIPGEANSSGLLGSRGNATGHHRSLRVKRRSRLNPWSAAEQAGKAVPIPRDPT